MQGSKLATRVSSGTACERCRRQKQRCEPIRPCSNCINAKKECVVSTNLRPTKRARTSASHSLSSRDGTQPNAARESQTPGADERSASKSAASARRPSNSVPPAQPRKEPSMVAEFGNSESAMEITRRVLQSHRSPEDRATFAIPGGDTNLRRDSLEGYHSISDLVGVDLPSKDVSDTLLDVYFYTVHWFSLVVYEPTFRQRYHAIITMGVARSNDRPFLLLLLMILVLSCHYGNGIAHDELENVDLDALRSKYLKQVRNSFMDLLDEDNLEFVQICILLGSYWLYWGKPSSSFTLLGAAIKSAQALSLHREMGGKHSRRQVGILEERKRVWWTIYTWDRFATVVYGRPLGISDRDCDVPMPSVFTEHIADLHSFETVDIELSPYQTSLNTVYQIASPMLENIYSIRCSTETTPIPLAHTVQKIDDRMQEWRRTLPKKLDLESLPDLDSDSSLETKLHQLQALSLRLTYLNLLIIIHRPLLADWTTQRNGSPSVNLPSFNTQNGASGQSTENSFDQCLSAALSVSRLGQNTPNLLFLAGQTHLLSFLAMNIFTSSVVLFIYASANILSNAAQEAKRGMSRNLKILRSLPNTGSLSRQCTMIMGDLIQMILDKEKEEMLQGPMQTDSNSGVGQPRQDHMVALSRDAIHDIISRRSSVIQHSGTTTQHVAENNIPDGRPEATFGRTMDQLHRVLKDASNSRSHRSEAPVQDQNGGNIFSEPLWSQDPFDIGQSSTIDPVAPAYAYDMNQFWLWDFDPSNDFATDWSNTGYSD